MEVEKTVEYYTEKIHSMSKPDRTRNILILKAEEDLSKREDIWAITLQ